MSLMIGKKITFRLLLCTVLLLTVFTGFAFGDAMRIAVSPFENAGPDRDSDYLGFQISEFLSSSFASFPDIQIVERGQIQRVFQEQQLQLSGVTDSEDTVELGRILNARQIVVGSFIESPRRMSITARIIDSQTADILSSATVEAPRGDSYGALYRALFAELISGLPAYKMTIPVEATLDSIDRQAQQASQNYARALQALFENDDEKALRYLRESIAGEGIDIVRFDELAQQYSEVLERTEGATVYTQMIQRQIDHNRTLTEQIEPLSLYRSTLRVLADRVAAQIVPERFTLKAETASQDKWTIGTVSVFIPVPQNISVSLNEDTISRIATLMGEQDIVSLQDRGIRTRRPPSGRLLSSRALNDLFKLGWEARIGYAIEFLGNNDDVLFRLKGEPIPVVTIAENGIQYSKAARGSLMVDTPADGWRLLENGVVEVQSRNLRNLASVRVVIDPDSFHLDYGFMLYQDIHWESLITHAYRINSVKIDTGERDFAPAFKEVIISDSRFFTGDQILDPVPVLPRDRRIAPFARPVAYVYMADEVSGTVNGVWQGQSDPEPITGRFTNRDVLVFDYPYSTLNSPRVQFTATFQDSRKIAAVFTEDPADPLLSKGIDIIAVAADHERVFLQSRYSYSDVTIRAYNPQSGSELWSSRLSGRSERLVSDGRALYGSSGVALNAASGREIWAHRSDNSSQMIIAPNLETLLTSYGRTAIARELRSGVERWRYDGAINISSVFTSNGLYRKLGDRNDGNKLHLWSYDPFTGRAQRRLHVLEGKFSGHPPGLLDAAEGILLAEVSPTLYAFDTSTNKQLWAYDYWNLTERPRRWPAIGKMTVHNGVVFLVYTSTNNELFASAIDLISGHELWRTAISGGRTDVHSLQTDGYWLYLTFGNRPSNRRVSVLNTTNGQHSWTSLILPTHFYELNATLAIEEGGDKRAYLMNSTTMPHFQTPMYRTVEFTTEVRDASAYALTETEIRTQQPAPPPGTTTPPESDSKPQATSQPLAQSGSFTYRSLGGGIGDLYFGEEAMVFDADLNGYVEAFLSTYFVEATLGWGYYSRNEETDTIGFTTLTALEIGLGFLGNIHFDDMVESASAPSVFYATGRITRTYKLGSIGLGFGGGINYLFPELEVKLPDNARFTGNILVEPLVRLHIGRLYVGLSIPVLIDSNTEDPAIGFSLFGGIGSFSFSQE